MRVSLMGKFLEFNFMEQEVMLNKCGYLRKSAPRDVAENLHLTELLRYGARASFS